MEVEEDLYRAEDVDLKIFDKFVTPHYKPSESPLCMCVGASCVHEGRMLREYHHKTFGNNGSIRIAACNIGSYCPGLTTEYDLEIYDPLRGDATTNFPYHMAMGTLSPNTSSDFDLVYIRNPDLEETIKWHTIFHRALDNIEPTGVVVTLIRETDLPNYRELLSHLENDGINPVVSSQTGFSWGKEDSLFGENFVHTIGVFKRTSR